MHLSYVIIGISFLLKKCNIGNRKIKFFTIIFLIFFMFLVGQTPSVQRACYISILSILSSICYQKNDVYRSLTISLILILIQNPYSIMNIGLILSYSATLRNFSIISKF